MIPSVGTSVENWDVFDQQKRKGVRSNENQIFTYVHEGWAAGRELCIQSGLRVGRDGSSQVRPEVLRVLFLPIIPDFVDHLGETPNFSLSSCR